MKKTLILLSMIFILMFIMNVDVEAQCAMCRAQLEASANNPDAKNTGINSGILYLMLFPYIIIAIIAYMWYRCSQKSKTIANG
jgi:uncharacterized paraquat-inducible protein A